MNSKSSSGFRPLSDEARTISREIQEAVGRTKMRPLLVYPDMYESLITTIRSLETPGTPAGLSARITKRIELIERGEARTRLFVSSGILILAGILFVPALRYASDAFAHSGFSQYLGLIFSDSSVVFTHWQSFALSLTESFPIVEVTIIAIILFSFIAALRTLVASVGVARKTVTA